MDEHRIRQVLFKIEGNKNYKFDVNSTTSIKGLKRMLTVAANLRKTGFKLFNNGIDFTDEDDSNLSELFPDQQLIEFIINISQPTIPESESRIKLKLGHYCQHHIGKYLYFYCYDCSLSICSSCTISSSHKGHNIIEKYDYLQSSKHLVDLVFSDMTNFVSGVKLDKKSDAEELKNKIKNIYYPKWQSMLKGIEMKMLEFVDAVLEASESSFSNMKENINSFKDNCSTALDKLKEEIHIEDIMMNQEIFLVFDKKYKEIENEKYRMLEDKKKCEELSENFQIVGETIEKMNKDIFSFLEENNKSTVLSELKHLLIHDKSVELVKKQQIVDRIMSDVKIRKSGKKSALDRGARNTVGNFPLNFNLQDHTHTREVEKNEISAVDSIFNFKEPDTSRKVNSSLTTPIEAKHNQSVINNNKTNSEIQMPILASLPNQQNNDEIIKHKVIMRVDPNTTEIIYYDDDKADLSRIQVKFSPFHKITNFLFNCAWINHNQKLYITGGRLSPDSASNSFLCYDYLNDKLTTLSDMCQPRQGHSMIYHNNAIYVVGGYQSNTCEKFDFSTMKWTKLNSLIVEERQNSILYVHNNYLYCFFGYQIGSYLDTIEKLKLSNSKARWETVPYKNPDKIDLKLVGCGIVRYDSSSILFLGGGSQNHKRSTAFKFDFSTCTATNTVISLEEPTHFQESALENLGDGSFGHFDNEKGDNFLKVQMA